MHKLALHRIVVTDANYGTEIEIRADHITAITVFAETTYRDGMIPDGVFRRTLLYTLGGNQLAVRETPTDIWNMVDDCPCPMCFGETTEAQ